MEKKKNTWGGARQNAGRPTVNGRKERLSVRLSPLAMEIINRQPNKSQFVEQLILKTMRYATLINKVSGQQIRVHATTEHPDSSYGRAVWVDDDNNAYAEVDSRIPSPLYDIKEDAEV